MWCGGWCEVVAAEKGEQKSYMRRFNYWELDVNDRWVW